jgi:hypothetical protein
MDNLYYALQLLALCFSSTVEEGKDPTSSGKALAPCP